VRKEGIVVTPVIGPSPLVGQAAGKPAGNTSPAVMPAAKKKITKGCDSAKEATLRLDGRP